MGQPEFREYVIELEDALLEYIEKYGLSELARKAFKDRPTMALPSGHDH